MENIEETHTELDLDSWLATGERTTHNVTLYARTDLIADIEELEAQIPPELLNAPKDDGALGGDGTDEFSDLRREIAGLYDRVAESKKTFRVTALTEQEVKVLRQEVEEKFKDEISKIAKQGRAEGKRTADNLGATVPNDVNQMIRIGATKAVDEFVKLELSLAIIAKATKAKQGTQLVQLSVDTVRSLYEKLGEIQVGRLSAAAAKANKEMPKVTPGK